MTTLIKPMPRTTILSLLESASSSGQIRQRAQRDIDLRFQEVDQRFVWITDREVRIGLVDREYATLEWIAPHPGVAPMRPAEIPADYHAPTYQGGRIVLQWWVDHGEGVRRDAAEPLPEPIGVLKIHPQSRRPRTAFTFETARGEELFLHATHHYEGDDRIIGTHHVTIRYDPMIDSYVAEVEATLEAPDPYFAEFCNFYAGGVYDNRPSSKRRQCTVWQHPDGRFVRWSHNPVGYLTPGMNDIHGERRIADGGFLGYFSDPYTNPVVEVMRASPPAFGATCCNIYDEHLCCLPPTQREGENYHWHARYRFFSVHPPTAQQVVLQSQAVRLNVDSDRYDAVRNEPDRTDWDLGRYLVYDPQFPGFYYGRVNDFEQPIPHDRTVVGNLIWASNCPDSPVYWDDDCGHSGHRSIRLQNEESEQVVSTRIAGGPTPHIDANQRYRLSGWIRCEQVRGRGAVIRFDEIGHRTRDGIQAEHATDPIIGTTDWTYVEHIFTASPTGQCAWLHLELDGVGRAWFDDIAIETC